MRCSPSCAGRATGFLTGWSRRRVAEARDHGYEFFRYTWETELATSDGKFGIPDQGRAVSTSFPADTWHRTVDNAAELSDAAQYQGDIRSREC